MKEFFCRERWSDDVCVSYRGAIACMREHVSAKKGLCGLFEKYTRLPVVRDVWRIDVPYAPTAEIDHLAICELARWSIAKVVERHHAADCAMCHLGTRRSGKKVVHRSALIGLDMSEGDPSQPRERNNAGYRLGYERKHAPGAGMK